MIITLIFYSLDISFGAIYFYFINEFSKLSIFFSKLQAISRKKYNIYTALFI